MISGIDLPFEYAVIRWNNDTAYQFAGIIIRMPEAEFYMVQLFPNDIFANSNYLKIYFPDKKDFLFKSLSYLAISSLVLISGHLVSFALTVVYHVPAKTAVGNPQRFCQQHDP